MVLTIKATVTNVEEAQELLNKLKALELNYQPRVEITITPLTPYLPVNP